MENNLFEMCFELEDIESVEETGYKNTYDITVSGDHSFILGNGVVSHNSACGGLMPVLGRKECGYYILRGKPLNSYSADQKKFTANKELSELYKIIQNENYQYVIFGTDQDLDGCLTGETKIPLLDGRTVQIKDLLDEKEFWVYSYDKDGNIHPGRGHSARITKYVDKLYRITLSNGNTIETTSNHPFMMRNGDFVNAENLKINDSLMPFKTKINNEIIGKGFRVGYREIFSPRINEYIFEHEMVIKENEELKRGFNIHHIDENKLNNSPENLVYISKFEHQSLHSKNSHLVTKYNGSITNLLIRIKQFVNKYPYKLNNYDKAKEFFDNFNHSIVNIEIINLEEKIPVYDISVDKFHNFATSSGVVVHNSHIRGLLTGFFFRYMPELKKSIGILETPVIEITKKEKIVNWYYNLSDEIKLKSGENSNYKKGLGSWDSENLKHVVQKDGLSKMIKILDFDNDQIIEDWLGNDSEPRKKYILDNEFSIAKL